MTADAIFLQSEGGLTPLTQTSYDSEALLQTVLAEYPEVLAGPTTDGDTEARLLLVRREAGIPASDGGQNVFSLDHLFLDSLGVAVLVEVKRSSDTRIRREVIGQMLDYAANGVRYWPVEGLRQWHAVTAAAAGRAPDELISELSPGQSVEEFWRTVDSNLRAGRIRMVFVADELPGSLVRIIEFLNEQMKPAEVLGVELRQYVSGAHTVYVPRVVGQTSNAVVQKSLADSGKFWDQASFLDAVDSRCTAAEASLVRRLLKHVEESDGQLSWGKGTRPSVTGRYRIGGQRVVVWNLNANDESPSTRAYMYFYFAGLAPKVGAERMEQAAKVLASIPALAPKMEDASKVAWHKEPSLYLGDAANNPGLVGAVIDGLDVLVKG